MIRIAENYASVKTLDLPVGRATLPIGSLPVEGTYTISFTYVVHYGEVMDQKVLIGGSTTRVYIPLSEGRISGTFEVDDSRIGGNILLYSSAEAGSARANHVTFHDIHIARGTQGVDIYTPPHTALTPEQIALMKYGEFTEAKQI